MRLLADFAERVFGIMAKLISFGYWLHVLGLRLF